MFTQNNILDYKELKEQYPKAIAKLVEWTGEGLLKFQKIVSAQIEMAENVTIPEITAEHREKATGAMLSSYFRTLYDFFSLNSLHVCVNYYFTGKWMYEIKTLDGGSEGSGNDFESRILAETTAFKQAFHLLNQSYDKEKANSK